MFNLIGLVLVSFVSLSHAETPVATTAPAPVPATVVFQMIAAPVPTIGATPVSPETPVMGSGSNIAGCTNLVSSATSAKKTGDLALKLADAEVRCLAEKNREAQINQDAEARRVTELAGAYFVVNGATPAATSGKSVSYTNGDVSISTGSAAEWSEYGKAVKDSNNSLNGIGGLNGTLNARYGNLFVMDQVRANMMAHPTVPNVPTTTTTDEVKKLKEQVEELKRANALIAENDGS